MMATSEPGEAAIQCALTDSVMSSRWGLTSTNCVPLSAACSRKPRVRCRNTPPELTCRFFMGSPPKASRMSVCAAIVFQCVPLAWKVSALAMTRGRMTLPAALL
jgi:hypothetical protein